MLSHNCVVGHSDCGLSPCNRTWLQYPGFEASKQVAGAQTVSFLCALKMEGSARVEGNAESRKLVKVKIINS